jgi:transposase
MSLLGFEAAPKVFLYAKPTDMRKGFDGLYGLVLNEMELDPKIGYLFLFINKNRNLIKILRIHPSNYTSSVPGNKSCNLLHG